MNSFKKSPCPEKHIPLYKHVKIFDSVSGLSSFCFAELPSSAALSVQIYPHDFERLERWPFILKFLKNTAVTLSLSGHRNLQLLLDQTCRLWQVASLPNVQLKVK